MIRSEKKLELTPNNQVYRAYWYNPVRGAINNVVGPDFFKK